MILDGVAALKRNPLEWDWIIDGGSHSVEYGERSDHGTV